MRSMSSLEWAFGFCSLFVWGSFDDEVRSLFSTKEWPHISIIYLLCSRGVTVLACVTLSSQETRRYLWQEDIVVFSRRRLSLWVWEIINFSHKKRTSRVQDNQSCLFSYEMPSSQRAAWACNTFKKIWTKRRKWEKNSNSEAETTRFLLCKWSLLQDMMFCLTQGNTNLVITAEWKKRNNRENNREKTQQPVIDQQDSGMEGKVFIKEKATTNKHSVYFHVTVECDSQHYLTKLRLTKNGVK